MYISIYIWFIEDCILDISLTYLLTIATALCNLNNAVSDSIERGVCELRNNLNKVVGVRTVR